MKNSKNLKAIFEKNKLVRIVGAHDGITAKLISRAGFEGVWASGLEISASYGVPDANILTMTQYLERAIEMNDSSSLPVIADCDTGYGNVNNVIHMIESYEKSGISSVCIEDKLFPKVNSFFGNKQPLASISEFCGKLEAAKATKKNKDFMVIARIEALIARQGMKEALKRAYEYSDAGADAILIHSKEKSPVEIIEFCKKFKSRKIPIVVVPTTYPKFHENLMPNLGIKMVIYANQVIRSSVTSIEKTLQKISKNKNLLSVDKEIVPVRKIFDLQSMNSLKENEEKYLDSDNKRILTIIPAAGKPPKGKTDKIDKFIESRYPVCLIKIKGESILKRNKRMLNSLGLKIIKVITGFKSESFKKNGDIQLIKNEDYNNCEQIDSIMVGLNNKFQDTLILFSDVLFDRSIISKLINSKYDISIGIDKLSLNNRKKYADYLEAEHDPVLEGRSLLNNEKNLIKKFSKKYFKNSNYEFIGAIFLKKVGIKSFVKEYKKLKTKKKKFDLFDLLNSMVKKKFEINGVEINSGWIEIRDRSNFELAKKYY